MWYFILGSFKSCLHSLMVTDRNFTQSFHTHYEMDESSIGHEFRVVYHCFTPVVANTAGADHSEAHEGVLILQHIGLRINLVAMSRQCGTPR